jgi:carboxyl-terminal processing protease
MFRRTFFVSALFVISGLGFWFGYHYQKGLQADSTPYRELEKLAKVLQFVESNYVSDVKAQHLVESAVKGVLAGLDPHSAYLNQEVFREMREETSGKFSGLGVEVTIRDGSILVVSPIEGSPADRAGVRPGDVIIRIDGKSTRNVNLADAINMMRGKMGSKITLTVERKGQTSPMQFVLVRDNIKVQSVRSQRLSDNLGYFRITSFMERTSDDLAKAFDQLQSAGALRGLILDLRGNPGGLLDQAVRVVNLFIDEGPVVYTVGRDKAKKEIEYAQRGRMKTELPLVVLVDSSSASASEIVAGALQDYRRAVVAGSRTFGKGSVQTVVPLGDDSGLKLTVARYYTPSGRSIQVQGIEPDVQIEAVDPKVLARLMQRRRSSEADLDGHFQNESITDQELEARLRQENVEKNQQLLSLADRLKTDYAVIQAQGILRTLSLAQLSVKKPEFRIEAEKP